MSGSVLAAIIVPVVMIPVLFIWIGAVFYAASHPEPRPRSYPPEWGAGSVRSWPVQVPEARQPSAPVQQPGAAVAVPSQVRRTAQEGAAAEGQDGGSAAAEGQDGASAPAAPGHPTVRQHGVRR